MLAVLAMIVTMSACGSPSGARPIPTKPPPTPSSSSTSATASSAAPTPVATLIAVGDIAVCDAEGDEATGSLVARLDPEATVATLGDLAYPDGSEQTYSECYDPVWGAWKGDRTRPALGNHDVFLDGGLAFAAYFGDAAGTPGEGWYSYDLGAWHVVVLNSNCRLIGCGEGSEQLTWLTADLAQHPAACTLAYWHHPRFSSGRHGDDEEVAPLWDALVAAHADVLLVGHDHLYERFAPRDGLRAFTVGTGGGPLTEVEHLDAGSEVTIDNSYGVLELTLRPDGYDWRFLEADAEATAADIGSTDCH